MSTDFIAHGAAARVPTAPARLARREREVVKSAHRLRSTKEIALGDRRGFARSRRENARDFCVEANDPVVPEGLPVEARKSASFDVVLLRTEDRVRQLAAQTMVHSACWEQAVIARIVIKSCGRPNGELVSGVENRAYKDAIACGRCVDALCAPAQGQRQLTREHIADVQR